MPPSRRFAIVFLVALAFVPFLPLYAERTMTQVMFAQGGGRAVVALAFTYTLAIALSVALILGWKRLGARRDASIAPLQDS